MAAINVTDAPWGVVMDGIVDNTSALAAISAHIAGLYAAGVPLPRVQFPDGICLFNHWPDFAFPRFEIVGTGSTRLRYTGNGIAVDLDGLVRPYFVRDMTFGPFTIEGGANSTHALRVRDIHTSRIRANTRGCGADYSAFLIAFAVCSEFWLNASVNDWGVEGWYENSAPKIGIEVTWADDGVAAKRTTQCVFHNPIMEGLNRGAYVAHADGNQFVAGTMEACYDWGIYFDSMSAENKVVRGHFEGNGASGGGDIFVQGSRNVVLDSKTGTLVKFYGSADGQIKGGTHNNIAVDGTASRTLVADLAHTGILSGAAYKRNIMDLATGIYTV